MPAKDKSEDIINSEVEEVIAGEAAIRHELMMLEQDLSENPKFKTFLLKQAELRVAQDKSSSVWKQIEEQMIQYNVKTIKGDWGSITIAERIGFDVDEDLLPNKFFKKVVDTKRIADTYKLEGKDIKGATVKYTKYLTKRLK